MNITSDASAAPDLKRHQRRKLAALERRRQQAEAAGDPFLVSDEGGAALINVSRASFWRYVGSGILPPPIKLGGRTLWRKDELRAAVDRLTAERDGAE